jgi:hypothetical protein
MFRMPSGSGPPSRSLEGAGLVADPAFAAEDDRQQNDDHDQIDAEYGEQRDEHAVTITRRRLSRLTRDKVIVRRRSVTLTTVDRIGQ